MKVPHYTIGVKIRFLPFFRKYKVTKHENETIDGQTRLIITHEDGSVTAIPDIINKYVKIYGDIFPAKAQLKLLKEEKQLA